MSTWCCQIHEDILSSWEIGGDFTVNSLEFSGFGELKNGQVLAKFLARFCKPLWRKAFRARNSIFCKVFVRFGDIAIQMFEYM